MSHSTSSFFHWQIRVGLPQARFGIISEEIPVVVTSSARHAAYYFCPHQSATTGNITNNTTALFCWPRAGRGVDGRGHHGEREITIRALRLCLDTVEPLLLDTAPHRRLCRCESRRGRRGRYAVVVKDWAQARVHITLCTRSLGHQAW